MEKFDVMVIGAGSGEIIVDYALNHGMKVALIEKGPLGGTCANRGCIPSKLLLHPADVVDIVKNAGKFGINARTESIDFKAVMERMRSIIAEEQKRAEQVDSIPNLKWFKDTGEFIGDYTLKVSGTKIKADAVFIVSGARPYIPRSVEGLEDMDYLTSDTLLELEALPKSLIIVGGGYIAAEYAHFFSSMGSKVTVVQRAPRLMPGLEPEISELLEREMSKKMEIFTNHEVIAVKESKGLKEVTAKQMNNGKEKKFSADAILIAAGRLPNSDLLKPEKTGVKLDKRGFVVVNEYLETSKEKIWAFGDAIGKYMFKHVANYEARVAWYNAHGVLHPQEAHSHEHAHAAKVSVDYHAVPYAVFSNPEIAAVGLTEQQARENGYKLLVAKEYYRNTAKGEAMHNPEGFVKIIVEKETQKLLGGHIVGPHASILIQEITTAMNCGDGTILPLYQAMHIHPALTEVVSFSLGNFQEV